MVDAAQDRKFTKEDIIHTSRRLCDDYVEDRLIRSGLQLKERKVYTSIAEDEAFDEYDREGQAGECRPKSNTTVGKKKISLSSPAIGRVPELSEIPTQLYQDYFSVKSKQLFSVRDKQNPENVSRVLIAVGELLERRHSAVYNDVFTQLNISVLSEITLKKAHSGVAKQIFADGISWAKIVSLFAFTGALAVECVANGANTYVARLKTWTVQFTADYLSEWIILHDGWGGLAENFAEDQKSVTPIFVLTLLIIGVLLFSYGLNSIFGSVRKK